METIKPEGKDLSSPFVELGEEDVSKLIPILEKRLPKSCIVIHNCAKMQPRFKNELKLYTLNGEIDDSSWIVVAQFREDYGMNYSISAVEKNSKISSEEAKRIFSNCKLFNWEESYFFLALEKWLSRIIFDISVNLKGNPTEVHPCNLYYMDIEESLKLEIKPVDSKVEVKRLDPIDGVDFILKTWFYSKEGTDVVMKKCIEKNESGGVYIEGKPVAGVCTLGFGMLTALYTLEEHRKKGYAKLCMRYAFKEVAKNGFVPSLLVELFNKPSLSFHEGLGCKVACRIDTLFFTKSEL